MAAVAEATGRVVVTSFASNLARMKTLGQVAKANNRKLCIAGRSLDRMLQAARENGYLKNLPPLVDFDTAMKLPARDLLVIATGGQGEGARRARSHRLRRSPDQDRQRRYRDLLVQADPG